MPNISGPIASSVIYPLDQQALVLAVFIRVLIKAKKSYPSPQSFFSTLGIEVPPNLNSWEILNLTPQLFVSGCVATSTEAIKFYEEVFSAKIVFEEES